MINRLNLTPRLRMLLRRGLVATLGLVIAAAIGTAIMVATRDYAAIEREVVARLEQETGAVLTHEGRRQSLWPRPRIIFNKARFTRPDGSIALTSEQAELHFELRDLIDGTVDGPAIVLVRPDIAVQAGHLDQHWRSPRAITNLLDAISARFDRPGRFKRLTVTLKQAHLRFLDASADGENLDLTPVEMQIRYSARRSRVEIFARQEDSVRPIEFSATLPTRDALGQGKPRSASFVLAAFGSRLTFAGTARRDPDMALVGRLEASMGDTLERMIFRDADPGEPMSIEPSSFSATVMLDPRGIGLESLVISRGSKRLNGIAALREINGRWGVSATLAGDLVDGTAASTAIRRLHMPDGTWSSKPLSINPIPAVDLDIRLSTKEFKLANLALSNVALSILTRNARAEYAIVDSRLGSGTLKARVSVADTPEAQQDVKLMLSGDRIDMASFLDKAFGFTRLSGTGNLVLQAEGSGTSTAGIVGTLSGSGALEVQSGEIVGIDLQKLLSRSNDTRTGAALLVALAGKTAFENLRINVTLKDGRLEPVGSTFTSARVTATLEGVVELGQQVNKLALFLRRRIEEAGLPSDFYAFRLEGPLFSPSLKPDLKLLNRS
jgi:AsmA protein